MDETQYLIYEEYTPVKFGDHEKESIKESTNKNSSSVIIPSLYLATDLNPHHQFKHETPSVTKNVLVDLSLETCKSVCEQSNTIDCHRVQTTYEVKDSNIFQSQVEIYSTNLNNSENSIITTRPNCQIDLPPIAHSDVIGNSTYLSSSSEVQPIINSNSLSTTVIDGNRENTFKTHKLFNNNINSNLSSSRVGLNEISKIKKINPEYFVKLGLLTLKSTFVEEDNNELDKSALYYCSHCDMSFSSCETLTKHENLECPGNLSSINILKTQSTVITSSKNGDSIEDGKYNCFSKGDSCPLYSNIFLNPNNCNYKAVVMPIWNCLLCLKELTSLSSLESHYNLHSIEDLSKVLIKFTEPHYSCSQVTSLSEKREKFNMINANLSNKPNLCHLSKPLIKNNSKNPINSADGGHPSFPTAAHTKDSCNGKAKSVQSNKQTNKSCKFKKLNILGNNEQSTDGQVLTCKNLNEETLNLSKIVSTKNIRILKKSRSIACGPGSRDPHQCTICKKILSSRGNLAKHLIQHQTNKPWSCSTCDSQFNSKRDRNQHHLQRHTNIRPFVCSVCAKGYVSYKALEEHLTFHSTEKSFICKLCGKTFLTSKCLRRHMQRHEVTKKFSCELCCKSFRVKGDLFSHMKKIHLTSKKLVDTKTKSLKMSSNYFSTYSNQFKNSETLSQISTKKIKNNIKVGVLNKYINTLHDINSTQQNDLMKEVGEYFIPTSSTAVMFPELSEISGVKTIKNEDNFLPVPALIPVDSNGDSSKYVFNPHSIKNKADLETTNAFVMLGIGDEETGIIQSSQALNCPSDLPILYNQELNEMQPIKIDQRNVVLDQILSSIHTENNGRYSQEPQTNLKNGEARNLEEIEIVHVSKTMSNETEKKEFYIENGTFLNGPQISKPTLPEAIDEIIVNEHSQNLSLEMISQSLHLEFPNSNEAQNQTMF